jgi:hypothetical protein
MVSKLTADILEWQKSQTPPERPPPYCFIVTTNVSSQKVFEACGFERGSLVHWIVVVK